MINSFEEWVGSHMEVLYSAADILGVPLEVNGQQVKARHKRGTADKTMGFAFPAPMEVVYGGTDLAGDFFSVLVRVSGNLHVMVILQVNAQAAKVLILDGKPDLDGLLTDLDLDYELAIEKYAGPKTVALFETNSSGTGWLHIS